MKECKNCKKMNPDDAKFCINCGQSLDDAEIIKEEPTPKERIEQIQEKARKNVFLNVSRIIAIIAAIITIVAYTTTLALLGITLSVISVGVLAIGYKIDKMKEVLRVNLLINIYSFLANFAWLAYHLWIAPGL